MRECQSDPLGDFGTGRASPTPNVLGIIPARMGSSRFPGKPLALIGDFPMIWHVYQRGREAGCLNELLVATPDDRIGDVCQSLEIPFVLTQESATGDCIDCIAEVSSRMAASLYVCIQGDEPCMPPEAIRRVTAIGQNHSLPVCGCAVITDPADVVDVTVPKVVLGSGDLAIYLSRSPVPYPKSRGVSYYAQVCVYAFQPTDLAWFAKTPVGPLEKAEGIGVLRFLEHHVPVQFVRVPASEVMVDTPEDLERARKILFDLAENRKLARELLGIPNEFPRIVPSGG